MRVVPAVSGYGFAVKIDGQSFYPLPATLVTTNVIHHFVPSEFR